MQPFTQDKDLRLDIIWIGDNPESEIYVKHKKKAAESVGISVEIHKFPETAKTEEIMLLQKELNQDDIVTGYFIQLPIPEQIDKNRLFRKIDPVKDVDGLNPLNLGLLWQRQEALAPATAAGIMRMIKKDVVVDLMGKNVVIVNDSIIVGRPLAALLLKDGATVSICTKHTENLQEYTRVADILITATGVVGLIKGDMIKEGVVLIDVGTRRCTHVRDGKSVCKICGDVEFDSCLEKASFITPVPGGVGPVTVAMLLANVCSAYKIQNS